VAQGTVEVFDSFVQYSFEGNAENPFDLGATPDVLKCAIVSNAVTPATNTSDPTWGAAGGTNMSTDEESGGTYTAGGLVLSTVAVTNVAGVIHLDFDDPATWAQNVGNPTSCYYGIIYSDTATDKNCIGYVDLGGVFNAVTGDLTITWGAPFMTADQA
jgi:hypothetical protein